MTKLARIGAYSLATFVGLFTALAVGLSLLFPRVPRNSVVWDSAFIAFLAAVILFLEKA